MINKNDRKYVIPLSSAKEKHKAWKNVDKECYLIYEIVKKSCMGQNDIWVEAEQDNVKHILSVLDIKKIINEVIGKANRLYDKQMETGKVVKFCCDFRVLEEVADQ